MGQWIGGNSGRKMTRVMHTNTNQKGIRQQDKRDVTVPSDETAHLVVIEPQLFGRLKVFLNVPPVANGPNRLLQGRCR